MGKSLVSCFFETRCIYTPEFTLLYARLLVVKVTESPIHAAYSLRGCRLDQPSEKVTRKTWLHVWRLCCASRVLAESVKRRSGVCLSVCPVTNAAAVTRRLLMAYSPRPAYEPTGMLHVRRPIHLFRWSLPRLELLEWLELHQSTINIRMCWRQLTSTGLQQVRKKSKYR